MNNKEIKFEWYVLNEARHRTVEDRFQQYPYSVAKHIKPYNIFNNINVYEATIKLCKDYKTEKMTFEQFVEELRRIIMWQEWSRCEYEIMAGGLFDKPEEYDKIDCYLQALPNIEHIARYVLNTYYPRLNLR